MQKHSAIIKALISASFGFGLVSLACAVFKIPSATQNLEATASPYESAITLDSSNCPTTSKTWVYAEYTISGTTFFYNEFEASDYAADHGTLRTFYQPFITNHTAFSNYNYAEAVASCSTGTVTLTIYGSNTLYTGSPVTDYTALASLTLQAGTYSTLKTAIPEGTSYSYLAVGASTTYSNRNALTYISSITFARQSFTLSLSGASSIPFGNNGLAYPYTVQANYSTGVSVDVTGACQVLSKVDPKVIGTQTFSLSYQAHQASQSVEVTNVGSLPRNVTASSSTFSDSYFYDELQLPSNATLNGRTFTFSSDLTTSTGAWDLLATPKGTVEYSRFSGGYWQLGKTNASYSSLTLTSRRIYRNITSFSYAVWGGSGVSGTVSGTIGTHTCASKTLPASATSITEDCSANPITGTISFTIAQTSGVMLRLGHLKIVTSGGEYSYYTVNEQANATRDYIQQYKTCPGGVSDAVVERCALEYNATSVDTKDGSSAKAVFKTLSETVKDYDYSDASQYSNGTYTGGTASLSGINIYDKLTTMVKWYNQNHSTKIYLYDDSYYAATDNGGNNGYLPVFMDQAGHVVSPSANVSATSMTLIIVAASGVVTLLTIAGDLSL